MSQFCFTWQNINVTVFEKEKKFWKSTVTKKTILQNASGTSSSSSLFAIMGSSGSGKTTLLRAISGRCRDKTGLLQLNNNFISDADLRDLSGYVPQQDIFTEYITVLEHLEFMTALQINNKNKMQKKSIIKQLLFEFGLEHQGPTLITNLSGGEKRRLSLATELIGNPLILFCDEPTTGLDSYSSVTVIQKLESIVHSGKLVLTTIHQPSSQLFQYFDNIILLSEGKIVFQGTRQETSSFFESMNLSCPPNYNPADFYLKCLTYEDIPQMKDGFKKQKDPHLHCDYLDNKFFKGKEKNNFRKELNWLLWRSCLSVKRNKGFHLGIYFVVLIEVIGVAFFYGDISLADRESVQNIEGFIGFLASEFTFTNMYSVVNVFPNEVEIFIREKNVYSSSSYFVSKILTMMPLALLTTITYMAMLFIMIKFLNGFYLWLQMTYLSFLVSMAGCALGLAFSATFSSIEHVDLYLGPLEFLLLLFSGVMVKLNKIPAVFRWIKYVSPFYYGFDSLSNLMWRNATDFGNCSTEVTPCYNNGTQVLQNYGIYNTFDNVAYDILYLHVLTAALCLVGLAGILRKKTLYSL